MAKIPVAHLNYFGDSSRQGFTGIYLDQEQGSAFVYLRCNMRSKFEDMKDEFDSLQLLPIDQEKLSVFITEMGKVIADTKSNEKRFIIGSVNNTHKKSADIIHVFSEKEFTNSKTTIRGNLATSELHVISMIYFYLMQLKDAMKNMEHFVDALQQLQSSHVIKHQLRFIEELNEDEGWGYVY